jgi:hypothetical protein
MLVMGTEGAGVGEASLCPSMEDRSEVQVSGVNCHASPTAVVQKL